MNLSEKNHLAFLYAEIYTKKNKITNFNNSGISIIEVNYNYKRELSS